jgi:hypothetical protein
MGVRALWSICAMLVAVTALAAAVLWPETCRTTTFEYLGAVTSCDAHVLQRIAVAGLGLAVAAGIAGFAQKNERRRPPKPASPVG